LGPCSAAVQTTALPKPNKYSGTLHFQKWQVDAIEMLVSGHVQDYAHAIFSEPVRICTGSYMSLNSTFRGNTRNFSPLMTFVCVRMGCRQKGSLFLDIIHLHCFSSV
jgi:hypothetical protein